VKEIITGRNPVYEVFRAHRRQLFRLLVAAGVHESGRLGEIRALAKTRKLPVEQVPRQRLDALGDNHQGVALETSQYPYAGLDDIFISAKRCNEPLFVLILDMIQNPQNLGTLLRTAEACGVHGILIPLARSATVTPAVVNASAGATEHLLIAQLNLSQAIRHLKDAGAWIIGLEGSPEGIPLELVQLDGPIALVVGNEGAGMRALVRKSCDQLAGLPMRGKIESLNAAVAGSIALYLASQARKKKAPDGSF
jgi:23S rRNA (guanosine2251-2'-O)-methyltransferase